MSRHTSEIKQTIIATRKFLALGQFLSAASILISTLSANVSEMINTHGCDYVPLHSALLVANNLRSSENDKTKRAFTEGLEKLSIVIDLWHQSHNRTR